MIQLMPSLPPENDIEMLDVEGAYALAGMVLGMCDKLTGIHAIVPGAVAVSVFGFGEESFKISITRTGDIGS